MIKGKSMGENDYLYDAFISYRHLPIDSWAAEKVLKTLESYKLPKALAKKLGKKGIARIFQDKEELVTSGDLANELENALKRSRYLILICSSKTVESEWVMHEVKTFKELGRQAQILILLVEGTPEQTIPQILRVQDKKIVLADGSEMVIQEDIEPLAADIRGENQKERAHKFKTEILRIIAPILGCSFDDLRQRHKERKNRRVMLGIALGVLSVGAFGIYNGWRLKEIEAQMNAKLATQSRALADQSTRLLEKGDRMRALLVALEALPTDFEHPERPIMKEVQYALANALYTYNFDMGMRPDKTLEYTNVLNQVRLSPEATKAVSISENGYIQIWDMTSSKLLVNKAVSDSRWRDDFIQFVNEEEILLYSEDKLQLINAIDGRVKWEKAIQNAYFKLLDEEKMGVIGEDQLLILHVKDGSLVKRVALPEGESIGKWVMANNEATKHMLIGNWNQLWAVDLDKGELLQGEQQGEYRIEDITCTQEGQFILALNPLNEDVLEDLKQLGTSQIKSMTIENEQLVTKWKREFTQGYLTKLRVVPDEEEPITVLQNQRFYILNHSTGESIKEYIQDASIVDYVCLGNYAYVATSKGKVQLLPFEDTVFFSDVDIDHEGDITSFDFGGGVGVMTGKGDKKIYSYRWLTGQEETQVNKENEYIVNIGVSPVKQYVYAKDSNDSIHFYKDNGKTFVAGLESEGYITEQGFLRDDEYFYTLQDNSIKLWEVLSGKEVKGVTPLEGRYRFLLQMIEDEIRQEMYCIYQEGILILDAQRFEEKAFISYDETSLQEALLLGKGQLMIRDTNNKLCLIDTEKQSIEPIQEGVSYFTGDKQLGLIGLVKEDQTLQVIHITDDKVVYEQELSEYAPIHCIYFEEGENKLWVGYEDTHVKIIDLKDGSEEEVAEDLPYVLEEVRCFKAQNKVILLTQGEDKSKVGLVYDRNSLTRLADVYGLSDVNEECSYFYITGYGGDGYVVPFYNTQQLAAEAVKQLEGRRLTDKEKRKFFIIE